LVFTDRECLGELGIPSLVPLSADSQPSLPHHHHMQPLATVFNPPSTKICLQEFCV
jgi:hypothetical protein